MNRKARVFWPVAALLLLADCTSKEAVVEQLGAQQGVPHSIVGDVLRFTLHYNTDAAMGITLGAYSRIGFIITALLAIAVLASVYRQTEPSQTRQLIAIALVCGGAAGNMLDRIRSARGVVDFIDVGLGAHRFYIFNVADMGVSLGAVALALLLWRSDTVSRASNESGPTQW